MDLLGKRSEPTVSLQMMKFLFVVCDGGHYPYIQIIRSMIGYVNSNYHWLRMMSEPQDALHHSNNEWNQVDAVGMQVFFAGCNYTKLASFWFFLLVGHRDELRQWQDLIPTYISPSPPSSSAIFGLSFGVSVREQFFISLLIPSFKKMSCSLPWIVRGDVVVCWHPASYDHAQEIQILPLKLSEASSGRVDGC